MANIKRSRAAVDENVLQQYHDNLSMELDGVPPSNIWNYDDTCLVNNPSAKTCIMKRGTRYPEQVVNYTKNSVSIMFCGNAEGEVFPPYCVYKSSSIIMDSWVRNAPKGSKFNRSKSGWFDEAIFKNFFNVLLLPRMKKQKGTKVMIGDNLSSHISEDVIRKCSCYDIKFICLPQNSTHITQPLDIAYFKPLKLAWQKILNNFRQTKVGQQEPSIPKDTFPKLLCQLVNNLSEENGQKT